MACKVEECPLPGVDVLASALEVISRDGRLHFGIRINENFMSKVMANEFVLMEALNSQLLVFHPYQDILAFVADFADHSAMPIDNEQISSLTLLAWNIVNDSYKSEACLLFAPHDVALAALFIATEKTNLQTEAGNWWSGLAHDLKLVKDAMIYIMKHSYVAALPHKEVRALCERLYSQWADNKANAVEVQ